METFTGSAPTHQAEQMLNDLADALEIPPTRYEAAERSYKSVGEWLDRPNSRFASHKTNIYPQGSFRLGTVIKPLGDEEDYDLDIVCELDLSKQHLTQFQLKELLGLELKDYAQAHQMQSPVEARRCWTLNYADGAQFHMDVLPALPDGAKQRMLIEAMGHQSDLADRSVAITDKVHQNYRLHSDDWPASNPKGYSEWFRSRMKAVFDARRQAMALKESASVEDIPEHRIRTPLQTAIKILKRHRDMRFCDEPDIRPISIIITTLASHAYSQETTTSGALYGILERMDRFIFERNGVYWVENPTDPRENFADKWEENPEKKNAFFDWLEMARADFAAAARLTDPDEFINALAPRMGRSLMEAAVAKHRGIGGLTSASTYAKRAGSKIRRILDAPHRKPVVWRELSKGTVVITSMTVTQNGYRPYIRNSDEAALQKNCQLLFAAQTDIQYPYKVFWQIVNTGLDARKVRGLRGGFEEGIVQAGLLQRRESTLYSGSHSIECFIVKDGYCVARSGPFIVNVL
ncbi:nucleotidyltransferase [Cupriavidus basilensis]|nr:nucleotidyltransferase [Cupriavidus basilensis]